MATQSSVDRDSVISAANVLMVAMLKMNRVIIPVLLKYNRARRLRWIQATERDLLREDARLCDRCISAKKNQGLWRYIPFALPDPATLHATHVPFIPHVHTRDGVEWFVDATPVAPVAPTETSTETEPLLRSHHRAPTPPADDIEDGRAGGTEDRVLDELEPATPPNASTPPLASSIPTPVAPAARTGSRVGSSFMERVEMEEHRRRTYIAPFVYTSVVTTTFTITTIWLYAIAIITTVLILFPFGRAQSIIFSFSLIATATISEAETLLRKTRKPPPAGAVVAAAAPTPQAPVASVAAKPAQTTQPALQTMYGATAPMNLSSAAAQAVAPQMTLSAMQQHGAPVPGVSLSGLPVSGVPVSGVPVTAVPVPGAPIPAGGVQGVNLLRASGEGLEQFSDAD